MWGLVCGCGGAYVCVSDLLGLFSALALNFLIFRPILAHSGHLWSPDGQLVGSNGTSQWCQVCEAYLY